MRILLIQPPLPYLPGETKHASPPLGLAYMAATLMEHGHSVRIVDCVAAGYDQDSEWGLSRLHYGLPWEHLKGTIREFAPNLIGISCLFTTARNVVVEMGSRCKRTFPDLPVVVGGSDPTVNPDAYLCAHAADYVVRGEGELALLGLVEFLAGTRERSQLRGVSYLSGHSVVESPLGSRPSVESLPPPARHLLPMDTYFRIGRLHGETGRSRRATTLVTSRGCPFDCVFCSIHPLWGYRFRSRSPELVVTEMQCLRDEYGVEHFVFEDDNLNLDPSRTLTLFEMIRKRLPDISWSAPNGMSIAPLNERILQLFKQTGCTRLSLAVESGCQDTLDRIIGKPLKLESVRSVVDSCNRIGLRTTAFFVIGLPGESTEAIDESLDFAVSLPVGSLSVMAATPYPGTRLERICKEGDNYCDEFESDRMFTLNPQIVTEAFSPETINQLISKTHLRHAARHPLSSLQRILERGQADPRGTFGAVTSSLQQSFRSSLKHPL